MPQKLQVQVEPADVRQDNFDPGRGNALQAAVASILGLGLKDVPNFIEMSNGYEAEIKHFCSQGGISAYKIPFTFDIFTLNRTNLFVIFCSTIKINFFSYCFPLAMVWCM